MRHVVNLAAAQSEFLFRQDNDATALGRLVGQGRELGRPRHLLFGHAGSGDEGGGLTIAQSDRACLVQEQYIHIASCLDSTPAHGEHVFLDQTVNARDTDGAEQSANGGWNKTDQKSDKHGNRKIDAAEETERLKRSEHDEEDDRECGKQNR